VANHGWSTATKIAIALASAYIVNKLIKKAISFVSYRNKISELPTLPQRTYPLVGHLYLFNKDIYAVYFRWMRVMLKAALSTGRKSLIFWFGPSPEYVIMHPSGAETLLKSQVLINKPSLYKRALPWLGDGLVLSSGSKWFRRRRLITPSFHFKILDGFLAVMNEQADIFVAKLDKFRNKSDVDMINTITLCTLDIICETAMGVRIEAQANIGHHYVEALEEISEINLRKFKKPWKLIDFLFNLTKEGRKSRHLISVLQEFTHEIIQSRLDTYARGDVSNEPANRHKRMAFLDVLINSQTEDGKRLTLRDLQDEVDTFMFAGHDTNATSLIWTLYLLGRNPEAQERLQREVDEVFAGADTTVTSDNLAQLTYTEMVIKESMRLFPPVSMVLRKLSEDAFIDGCWVPEGTTCRVMIYAIHRNPELWQEPGEFRPERFDRENSCGRHAFAFLPFSAGPRNCIGQRFAMYEQKVLLAKFVKKFSVRTNVDEGELKINMGLVTRPVNVVYEITNR